MGKNILIIEDDEFLIGLLGKKLKSEGFEVSMAKDGKTGAKKAKQEKPDLVLLDLLLPEIDGFEVLAMLKSDPEVKNIPVLVLSNLDQKSDIDKVIKLGAMEYLIKAQSTPEEIVDRIKKIS